MGFQFRGGDMKLMKYTFAVALTLSFLTFTNLCTAQTVYPQCNNLRGLEDSNGNTQLFYRIYSYSVDERYYNTSYDIWRYDAAKNLDTMYLDNSESSSIVGFMDFGSIISGYQIWKNDFTKYIYSYTNYGSDIGASIRRAININCSNYAMHYPGRFYISAQNENLLYTEKCGKSVDGGLTWSADALISGYISALSPLNDSVLYFRDNANRLCKTINRGNSAYIVDSTIAQADTFAFSSDGIHVFRTSYMTGNSSIFSISSNAGEYGSWTVLDSSSAGMFLSLDDVNKRVYIGYGKTIKVYDYAGNLQTEKYNLKKELTGLYKKPGTDKLYVLTKYELAEYTSGTKTILKQLPVALDNAHWHPLAIGNTWVYKHEIHTGNPHDLGYVKYKITGDTVMSNGKTYFCIKQTPGEAIDTYERYDTTTGRVYAFTGGQDVLIDETYIEVGDTVSQSCPLFEAQMICKSEAVPQYSIYTTPQRVFSNINSNLSYPRLSIYRVKNIGCTSIYNILNGFPDTESYDLSAYSVNGISGGDTTLLEAAGSENSQISQFSLNQNYPNPFNPSTTIQYSIPKAGQVKLNIYSVTGKLVASLVDEYKPAGSYTVNFNAANLPSGVYFYRLTSGSFVENRKMILLK